MASCRSKLRLDLNCPIEAIKTAWDAYKPQLESYIEWAMALLHKLDPEGIHYLNPS
jgi:uncharacterized Fe-S center protein